MTGTAAAAFRDQLLRYGPEVHAVGDAARAEPDDAYLNACAAAAELFALTRGAPARAAPFLARAHAAVESAADRLFVDAVAAWAAHDLPGAVALHRTRLARRPDDLVSAKLCQLHHIDLGDFPGMRATIEAVLPANPDDHYLLGQYAFALEEVDAYEEAAAAATRAVALATRAGRDDPWSWHALAHVHHRRGDLEAVIRLVEEQDALWARSSGFMATHAWWHAATCHLQLGRVSRAVEVFDARLAGRHSGCAQCLAARVSCLAQLRLAGVEVTGRLAADGDALAARADDHVNGFIDLHILFGLALLGRPEAARARAGLRDPAAAQAGDAMLAFCAGDPARAAALLQRAAPDLPRLGGSHEQRDLYRLVELAAAEAAGQGAHPARLRDRAAA